jgi:hypothetical protein
VNYRQTAIILQLQRAAAATNIDALIAMDPFKFLRHFRAYRTHTQQRLLFK